MLLPQQQLDNNNMGLGEMFARQGAKNQMKESWDSTKEYFLQWKNGDNANAEQRKEREDRASEYERKKAERSERKSKLADAWAANKSQNSSL